MPITITNRFSLVLLGLSGAVSLISLILWPVHYVKPRGMLVSFFKGIAVHLVKTRVISYLLNQYAAMLFND